MPESRRAFLSRKYDELFERASEVVKKHNPCSISNGVCRGNRRIEDGLCCSGCRHLGPNGCKVKSLLCKIWLCYHGSKDCPSIPDIGSYWDDMNPILEEAQGLNLCSPRCSKWKSINAVLLFGRSLRWSEIKYDNSEYIRPTWFGRLSEK